jgi:hypothetical protein
VNLRTVATTMVCTEWAWVLVVSVTSSMVTMIWKMMKCRAHI